MDDHSRPCIDRCTSVPSDRTGRGRITIGRTEDKRYVYDPTRSSATCLPGIHS